jgi:PcfK-like protein
MKPSNAFKETIKAYLEKRASEDELFAVTYQKENKNLDECCNYVMECAQKGGAQGYTDNEVFGWAVHYYDEDDIKNIKPISGKVIVNHSVELTEEDKKEAKEKAMQMVIEEAKAEAKKEISEKMELSEEEIQEAKKIALEKAVSEQKEKLLAKSSKKKTQTEVEQVDLFG